MADAGVTIGRAARDAQTLRALAQLRIAVFRDWPYIYDGSLEYEEDYLAEFLADRDAVLIVASVAGEPVGMATASRLAGQPDEFVAPLAASGLPVDRTFYFGESVLLPAWRGQGIGHAFFDHREAAARAGGATHAVFCAVLREAGHPLAPENQRDLAPFWRHRGYAPLPGVTAPMEWKDRDQSASTAHTMQFWGRSL
jgi:GNAT superfamily N-acetyltransferase